MSAAYEPGRRCFRVSGFRSTTSRATLALALTLVATAGCVSGRRGGAAADSTIQVRVSENTVEVRPAATPEMMGDLLERVTHAIHAGAEIHLAPGHYRLAPVAFTDSTCGNCQDPDEDVPATYGLRISGDRVRLVGDDADSVVIETNAGYGVLFDDCLNCELRGVTITNGARDPDGRATDAAVVVKNSDVVIRDCLLRDNVGDSATVMSTVVGIAGIVGRENSRVDVERCRIVGNSWDGIALYRGADARIHDNVIDGVDKAAGKRVGGGRGVGIGLTWDAKADVVGNRVTRYWKGIGVFVDADATVRENVVEDVLTWGIAFWSAAKGTPSARIEHNAVFGTGACGAMIAADPPADSGAVEAAPLGSAASGTFTGNAVAHAAQNERYDSGEPYCPQRPLALQHVPDGFTIGDNIYFDSRQPGDAWPTLDQLDRAAFVRAVRPLVARLRAWRATRASDFVKEFGSR